MARATPRVDGATLVDPLNAARAITVGTPPWYAWLEEATTFAFAGPSGRFTARKEQRGRAGGYWRAYRKRAGAVRSAYLGKTADLTLERLQAVAATLAAPASAADAPGRPKASPTARSTPTQRGVLPALPTGTVTFLFSDIAGSTELWEQHNGVMPAVLARHDAMLREVVEAHRGLVFKMVGDAGHAVFGDASDALTAAVAAQRAFHAELWGTARPLRVRMALHTGVAEMRAGNYYGPLLNRSARLLGAAHGGQILLSLVTAELVRDHLPPDLTLRDLGVHRLRDLTHSEQIFQLVAPDLPAGFPALNTLDRRPHNLPAQPTALIGREWEITNICNLLRRDDVRLVTLTGPGGAGKTRLALHVAADLLDQFGDGVYVVALAPLNDPTLVVPAIGQVLGIKQVGERAIIDLLKEYVFNKQLLLVLDNFEHLPDAALIVGELLTGTSRLKFLVTSRSVLRLSGEHEFIVPPLNLPDRVRVPSPDRLGYYEAVRLFVERVQMIRPDFELTEVNASAVVEICHRLDGLPLAIELAAARCKLFPPAALLDRLSSPLAILTGGARDLPERQQTLRATIEWSYNLLSAAEQMLFMRMAVFVGSCALEAIETVCASQSPAPVLDELASLVDKSLIRQVEGTGGETRLLMLETIRQYALERLVASDEAPALQRRHADYYLALAEGADAMLRGPEQSSWLARLEMEHDNLRTALEWYKAVDPERGLGLSGALWRFWEMRGHLSEGRVWLTDMLRLGDAAPAALRAPALHGVGVLASLQGDYQQAVSSMQAGLALFHEMQDHAGAAHVLRSLGLVACFQGEHDEAHRQLEQSVGLFRDAQHAWGIADALHWLGHVVLDQGNVAAAYALFEESLALFRETGDQRNIALPLKDFGLIESQQGNYATARAFYEESLALSRAVEDTWHTADTLQRLGDLVRLEGDYEQAATLYNEELELWRKLGNNGGIAEAMNLLGEVAHLRGAYRQATSFYSESLSLFRRLGSKRVIAGVLHNLGKATQYEQDYERAAKLYIKSLALNGEIGYTPGIADCFGGLAAVAVANGSLERAALLLGAAEPYLDTPRGYMPLTDRSNYDQTLATVREQLATATFAEAFVQGRALPLDQAIAAAQGRSLARQQGVPEPAPSAAPAGYPAGLTEREVAVLRLVAQGLTDAQVADQLVISRRTVNGHLRSIYGKLEVSSRTAAAHFAVTHHLV